MKSLKIENQLIISRPAVIMSRKVDDLVGMDREKLTLKKTEKSAEADLPDEPQS